MSLSVEDLMIPRVKLIAGWPGCKDEIGTIRPLDEEANLYWFQQAVTPEEVSDNPHLFRKLEWYEERESLDGLNYIKLNPDRTSNKGQVFKVKDIIKYSDGFGIEVEGHPGHASAKYHLPATEQDFLTYKQNNP